MEIGTKTIETERLILRPFALKDAQDMFNNWTNDAKVTEFLSWQPHKSIKETKKLLVKWRLSYHKKRVYHFAIELKEIGQVIGTISVVNSKDSWYNGDKAIVEKEIGYALGQNWWSRGIMTEALSAVIKFLFDNTDTTRITAKHSDENPASGKVMKKAGMIYEGTLRQYHTSNHGVENCCVYSILRTELQKNDN